LVVYNLEEFNEGQRVNIPHIPVLLAEVKEAFLSIDDGYIVDCTLGYGGHSEALLEENPHVKLIGCDQDEEALNFSKKRLERFGDRVMFHSGNFASVIETYKHLPIRGILADIGVSSLQLDKKERGFAFDSDVLKYKQKGFKVKYVGTEKYDQKSIIYQSANRRWKENKHDFNER